MLRLPPDLHAALAGAAHERGVSLNQWVLHLIKVSRSSIAGNKAYLGEIQPMVDYVKTRFGTKLSAVLVFGSQVTGKATVASDVDLMVILDPTHPIKRQLYRDWEDVFKTRVNPHFVHLPERVEDASGIWLEVALGHDLLYQRVAKIKNFLDELLVFIQSGRVKRAWVHGHPYWIRSNHEK